jgi:PhzF family phenazine biosynthesis protein
MDIAFTQVDAFGRGAFTGNPAAVMMLADWLPDAVLQGIAADNNLSETAFLVPHDGADADFALRWFTPRLEVAMCGHATLASGHVVLDALPGLSQVRFATRRAGVLTVARAAGGYALRLPAWPVDRRIAEPAAVARALGAAPAELWARGTDHLVALFDSPDEVRALRPDHAAIAALAPGTDLMLIATAPGEASDVLSRVFAPTAGIDEDPVTGSAHAVIAPMWAQRFGRSAFSAHQASARGGWLDCVFDGDTVVLSGQARTVIRGQYHLPDGAPPG